MRDFHPEARALLAACDSVTKSALYVRDPLPAWSRGAVTLLGDACHPMVPFMAQGACMAIEDAVVLGNAHWPAIGRTDVGLALKRYEGARKERTARVQIGSRGNEWLKRRRQRRLGLRLRCRRCKMGTNKCIAVNKRLLTRRAALGLMAAAPFFRSQFARADAVPDAFPKRPLTLVVPFSPGGPVDILGRLLAQDYQVRSGRAAIVENKAGGAGNIGIEAVQHANADGSTLLLIPAGNLTINPTLMPGLPFNVERDFAPICLLASAPNVIIVAPQLGVTSIQQLIAKAKTAKLSYGSPGVGSQLHLAMELFKEITGVDMVHVPYRGSPQALDDLLGGHIDVVASNLPAVLSAIQGKLVVALAMTTAERSPLVPEVPTHGGGRRQGHRRYLVVRHAGAARHSRAGTRRHLHGHPRHPRHTGAEGQAAGAGPHCRHRAAGPVRRTDRARNRAVGARHQRPAHQHTVTRED